MEHILGHTQTIDLFRSALQAGRLHHAWVFQGQRGVGKFTTACALGKLILCHRPMNDAQGLPVACGVCASCRLWPNQPEPSEAANDSADTTSRTAMASGHPDFHIITKELARYSEDASTRRRKLMTIPVEVLRDYLIEPVYRSAQLQHGKVLIVDEAELIDQTGQNILLKTLEEPPAGTHILLVTARPDKLLPTVQSRSQRLVFGTVPDELMSGWIDKQVPGLNSADRNWLLSFADGSPGRVLLAKSFDLFTWYRTVLPLVEQVAQGRPCSKLGDTMAQLINDLAQAWVDQHDNASKEAANKMASELMLSLIAQHARRAISQHTTPSQPTDDALRDTLEVWANMIESLTQAQRELEANVNLTLVMHHLASMMARPGRLSLMID